MGHGSGADRTVDEPEAGAPAVDEPAVPTPAEGTRWPTWADIARLHQIPGARIPAVAEPSAEPVASAEPAPVTAEPAAEPDRADEEAVAAVAPDEPEPADEAGPEAVAPDEPEAVGEDAAGDAGADAGADADGDAGEPVMPDEALLDATVLGWADVSLLATAAVNAAVVHRGAPQPDLGAAAVDTPEPQEQRPEASVEPEPELVAEPEPEPSLEPEPELVAEPEPDAALVTEPEPDATLVVEPVPDATLVSDPEPEPEPEPDPNPTLVVEPDAEPTEVLVAAPARISPFPVTSSAPASTPRATAGTVPVAVTARESSPLDTFTPDDGRRRWVRPLGVVVGIVVLLALGYVGASFALGDRVPRGATVAGVDIGGQSGDAAVATLDTSLAKATGGPLAVTANDVQAEIDPVAGGLTFDARATVDRLVGVDLTDPSRLWRQLVGVGEQSPVTRVDDAALSAAVATLSGTLALEPVDGSILFVDGTPHATTAADGWQLDEQAAARKIADEWLVAARPLALPTVVVEPDITQAETDAALTEVAQRVTSGPVTVTVADRTATLDAPLLAANASFVPQDGGLVLQLNGDALAQAVLTQLPDLLTAAADAHFEFQNAAPVIVPGAAGTTLDPKAVATAVGAAASKPTERTAALQLVETDPAQSTAALEALGIKEVVSEFSTPLTSEPRRTINIINGAAKISGTLIRPGETFSLTDALGPIDAAHGYIPAGVIINGEHTDALGGGLSQISTTTYNAAFFAGFQDVEHHPHSEWFARYPEGREATVFSGTLDLRWKNDTPYGALVQAWVVDGRVHVQIWGTKYWTVETTTSGRSNVRQPTTVYSQTPTCEAQNAGNPGFTVTVVRRVLLNGAVASTQTRTTTYKPQNKIICGPAPASP